MKLIEIINLIKNDFGSWAIIFIILSTLIEVTPIKLNPISLILQWFSKKMNQDVLSRLDKLENKLDEHIAESDKRDVRNCRELILNFGNSIISGQKHTKEEFDFIINECDKYETYCKKNNIPNGVATATITEIKRLYAECLKNNSFLQ